MLNLPWSGIVAAPISFVLAYRGMEFWRVMLIAVPLTLLLVPLCAAIGGTIWGGRDFWKESPQMREFRRKQRERP